MLTYQTQAGFSRDRKELLLFRCKELAADVPRASRTAKRTLMHFLRALSLKFQIYQLFTDVSESEGIYNPGEMKSMSPICYQGGVRKWKHKQAVYLRLLAGDN